MIDARGYACPMPVVMVQKAVQAGAPSHLDVLLDNRCAVENVTRYARNQGYQVEVREQEDDEFTLKLTK